MKLVARLFLILSVLLFLMSAVLFARTMEARGVRSAERAETASRIDAGEDTGGGYLMKSENGRIMLYSLGGGAEPRELGISYMDLPPEDRAMLDKGIAVRDERQLLSMLEDYTN